MTETAFRFIHHQVDEVARTRPDAAAVICPEGTMTFGELNIRANSLARQLQRLGVGAESVVGVCSDRSPELFIGLLAVWKAGGAYVPMDPHNPVERLAFILHDVSASVLLTQQRYQNLAPAGARAVICLDAAPGWAADEAPTAPGPVPMPDDLAYVIYTSGSTGLPKGVQISHRSLANHLAWVEQECLRGPDGGGAPLFSSVAFDLVVPTLWAPLAAGRPVHVLPPDADLGDLGRLLAQSGPFDFIKLTPSHLALLTRQLERTPASGLARAVIVGGEPLSGRAANRWRELTGGRVIHEYGPTENTVGTTAFEVMPCAPPDDLPIGSPLPSVTAYVLDEQGESAPEGVTGELYAGGAGVARGYHGRPALTAERFVPDPYGPPGSRLYRTGDLVRVRQDGAIVFLGRTDDQVKIRGYRVEVGEIASALTRLPGIDAAWAGLCDRGDGATQLVGYVVPAPGTPCSVAELRTAIARVLPSYMVPAAFVLLDAMPLTPNGKVDRSALSALTGSRASDGNVAADMEDVAGDETLVETIRRIWQEVLYVQQVSVHDDFFRLGGDSMTAVAVMFRLQEELDVDVPVHALFTAPTLAGLAEAVTARRMETSHDS